MKPDLILGIVAALAGFVLKTALAFTVCLVLSWLAVLPNRRFIVWLSFLFGSAVYWVWLANDVLLGGRSSSSVSSGAVLQGHSTAGALHVPGSWSFPLGIALRAMGLAYLLGLAYILFDHIKQQRQLRWVLGFTTKPPVEIAELFQPLMKSFHLHRARLLVLSGITSPATFGWIRPTILLPDACLQQDRSELEDILRHELHHVRRWDFVWNGLSIVCRALLFFHPAAWYAVRKMQFDRELACDLAVVSDSPGRRAEYAECLIHFARLNASQDTRAWGIDFAASSEHLKARVHSILAVSKNMSSWVLGLRITCGVILFAGFLGVAPSLAVLLSYERQQISEPRTLQPLTSVVTPSYPATGTRTQATRKGHPAPSQSSSESNMGAANLDQTEPIQPATEPKPQLSAAQAGSGPQLLRRSPSSRSALPAGRSNSKQQSVALIDPDASGAVGKSGDHDKKEALQQSVTAAAGIYRRLGAVDRH
jgi:beta-lactamase regulating signal transducer with metallopeptidase domain